MALSQPRLRSSEHQWTGKAAHELVAEHQALLHRLEACSAVANLARETAEIAEETHRPVSGEYRGTWKWVGVGAMASAMRRARRTFYAVDAARTQLEDHEAKLALVTFKALLAEGSLEPGQDYDAWRRDNGPRTALARLEWQAVATEASVP
ncbi:MAG: hypothetical protein M3Z33_03060 [Actinomycetota bacterium]|nr:hypothetical protein [Actinomycetota bacterium]